MTPAAPPNDSEDHAFGLTPVKDHQLDAIETEPLESLKRQAFKHLEETLDVAARLPFYSERFSRAGVDPSAICDFEDFAEQVPTFRKADLIAEIKRTGNFTTGIEALAGGRAANVVLTSGTLGFPTFATLGWGEYEFGSPREVLREFWMNGMRPGMRVMCQYPAWHHLSMLDTRALEWLGTDCLVPWGTFTPRFAGRALDLILEQRPEYLLTVTTMLHATVEEAARRNLSPHHAFTSVRYVMVVGEPVSPAQRQLLKRQLELEDLFERGGSSDGLWGGADCPAHAGHHVWLDHHHVEIIDPDTGRLLPPGERGSVVVTNLTQDRSLYVRFDTEDLGQLFPGKCPCGRTHPRVELYGRLADCARVQGRLISPYDVRRELDELPELTGIPLLLGRYSDDMAALDVYLDSEAKSEGIAAQAAQRLVNTLGVPVEVSWAKALPKRWKARMVAEKPIREPTWPRR